MYLQNKNTSLISSKLAFFAVILSVFMSACGEDNNVEPEVNPDPVIPQKNETYTTVRATFDTDALTRVSIGPSLGSRIPLKWGKDETLIIKNDVSGTVGVFSNFQSNDTENFRMSDSYQDEDGKFKQSYPLLGNESHTAIYHENSEYGWNRLGTQFKFYPVQFYESPNCIDNRVLPLISKNTEGNYFQFSAIASVLCFRIKSEKEAAELYNLILTSASKRLTGTSEYDGHSLGEPDGENRVALAFSSDPIAINQEATEFYVVVPSGTYAANDLTVNILTTRGEMTTVLSDEYTLKEGKVYDIDLDFEADFRWELALNLGKESATEIVIETNVKSKPEGAVDLERFGHVWHVLDGTTLRIQTTAPKLKINSKGNLFSGYQYVESIKGLEKLDTSEGSDCYDMFNNCKSLKSLDLSTIDTSGAKNMGGMFAFCESLTSLNLSSFNTSDVTNMEWMFTDCKSLTSLDLSSFNTTDVTDMGLMFAGCSALEKLDLSSFCTTNVTDMVAMFSGCESLTSLNLSSFNTSNVTDMNEMFSGCKSLTSLDLSSFDTSKTTSMYKFFLGCESLTSLDLSSFNTSNVTDMREMFSGCKSLTSLDLSSFNTTNVTNMGSMFQGCSSLESLDLSSFNTTNVTNMGSMFYGCSSLEKLDLSSFNTTNVTNMGLMFDHCESLIDLNLSSLNTNNTTIMSYMFQCCYKMKSLNLCNSFCPNSDTYKSSMFNHCGRNDYDETDRSIGTIYGVTDESVKNALRTGTDMYSMKFDGE